MISPELAGRLSFRHRLPTAEPLPPGRHALGLFPERDAVLVVPPGIEPRRPTPLMVLFHGGGGSAERIMPMMEEHARARGFLLLAPQSQFPTWDIVIAGHGPDRERLDAALAAVASRFLLDPARLAFAGHSDGGSYTLSIGLANGDLATHLLVSSAGFMSVGMQVGAPRVFISHGTRDEQIPIERSARVHAAKLREAGYDVTYVEYDGPHAWQPAVVGRGVDWFMLDRSGEGDAMNGDVVDVPERSRFELAVNGETAFVDYRLDGSRLVLEHTTVPDAMSGQGVGSRLAKGTLDAVRASGRRAMVECEFMAAWAGRHPEYDDIIDR